MARTPEEKRKRVEYNRRVYKVFAFKLHRSYDQDIIDYLATVTNKRAYICRLLREDMQKNNFRTICPKVENREDLL